LSRNPASPVLFLLCCQCILSCSREPPRFELEKTEMAIDGKTIVVEIARKTDEQARGLMFRRSLGRDEGMIFVYDSPRYLSFWMKNTRIPLSIAFIDGKGRVVQIEKMKPYDTRTRYRSKVPVPYALEMNQGWFRKNGVEVGGRVKSLNPKLRIPNPELRSSGNP
jgi:uncharacterized membrane protein (UPF0127 family)